MRVILVFFMGILVGNLYASIIINPQHYIMRSKKQNELALKVGGKWLKGNVNLLMLDAGGIGKLVLKKNLLLFLASGSYGETKNKEVILNKNMQHIRYMYELSDFLEFEAFVQHQYDQFRRIQFRFVYGGGPRLTIFKEPPFGMYIGVSLMPEYMKTSEDTEYSDSGKEYRLTRISSYVFLYLSLKNVFLSSTVYYQPDIEDWNDYRFLNVNTISFKITKTLSFDVSNNIYYDSIPPKGIEKLDISTTMYIKFVLK